MSFAPTLSLSPSFAPTGTPQQLAGYSLSLAAFGYYTRLRMQGTNKPKAA